MTQYDVPAGANETGCTYEPQGMWVRARIERPRRHRDGLLFELKPLDPNRPGRLNAHLSGDFIRQLQDATGVLLDPHSIVGEHALMLNLAVDPLLGLSGQIVGFERGGFLPGWAEQDAAVREAMEADRLWDRQHNLTGPSRLRRVFLVEPDDGAPHPLGVELARWWDLGAIELIRHPVAFEEPGSVAALHDAIVCAYDQYEWGTLDAVIVEPGSGFAYRSLSDDGLLRRIAVLPVPVITRRAGAPTLLDSLAHRSFGDPDEIRAFLAGILREELRLANRRRLEAIAALLEAAPAADKTSYFHGPLFD